MVKGMNLTVLITVMNAREPLQHLKMRIKMFSRGKSLHGTLPQYIAKNIEMKKVKLDLKKLISHTDTS